MRPAYGRVWNAFVDHQAELAPLDRAGRRHEAIGRFLWAIIFWSLITAAIGMLMKYMRWL